MKPSDSTPAAPPSPASARGANDDPTCPDCGGMLRRVVMRSAWLNDDQADSMRAGDWYCNRCPSNGRGNTRFRYFWDREVRAAVSASPSGPTTVGESDLGLLDEVTRELRDLITDGIVANAKDRTLYDGFIRDLTELKAKLSASSLPPSASGETTDGTAWVIVRGDASSLHYYMGGNSAARYPWSENHLDAMRYSSEADANAALARGLNDDFRRGQFMPDARVEEHMWLAASPPVRSEPSDEPPIKEAEQMYRDLLAKKEQWFRDCAPHDIEMSRDFSTEKLIDVLGELHHFTPHACHWALNVAADRLAAARSSSRESGADTGLVERLERAIDAFHFPRPAQYGGLDASTLAREVDSARKAITDRLAALSAKDAEIARLRDDAGYE